jgi:hypothetical protein
MHFQIVKMYKDKEVKKNVKDIFVSMCDVKIFWSCMLEESVVLLNKVITKLPNSEQSYKGKVKTHNYINR